jgi:hypothetical protein
MTRPLDVMIQEHDGFVLVSDYADPGRVSRGNVPTLHHFDGCRQSNGRNRLRHAGHDEIADGVRCVKCERVQS